MEEILNKNIFDDKALMKLSPDYVPSNTLLRLQVRRNMVKDTHVHGVFTYNHSQRKTAKLSKDRVKMNKEIEKLRNSFQNMNLKNEIILKNNVENNTQHKNITDDTKHIFNKTREKFETVKQVILNTNDKNTRINNEVHAKNKTKNVIRRPLNKLEYKQNVIEEFDGVNENRMISIEYKYNTQLDINGETEENTLAGEEDSVVEQSDYNDLSITNSRQIAVSNQINDLQSVLIMMAINSNSNEDEEPDVNESSNYLKTDTENADDLVLVSDSIQKEERPDFLNITQMRIIITDRQRILLNKYVAKWRKYMNRGKEYIAQQRQEAIKIFFEKLENKKTDLKHPNEECNKSKQLARDYTTYQHRYKMQKHIIALQKAKLEEQNRMIDELKYNKIIEASKHSVNAMKEEVRKTYFEIDRNLKPKIKLLTNELKIQEIEEPSLVLHCLKVPQFLQRMEKRAREREEKHAMIRERRKQMEEERIRLKQQAELAKLEMDKEEKLKRMKELREKRKKERIESIRKKQYADRMRSLTVMADLHYERTLMAKYCIRPLKKLMEIKRDNMEKAKAHYKFQLKKNVFLHWMFYTEDMWIERNFKAEKFRRNKIFKVVFAAFKQNHHEYVLKRQVAEDYYDLYVTQLIFRKLREGIAVIKKENELVMEKAELYYNRNLQFKILTCWRTLPALNAIKREQEARKARWREKVLQVVPDYMPPDE